jgi:hypothetical protein
MFGTSGGSYAAFMERNAPITRRLTLVQPSNSSRSVARACVGFTFRCLKAIGESYVQSAAYNPYWIGACPLPTSSGTEASPL